MSNGKIIEQAREWAALACSLAEINNADLSTADSANKERLRIAKLCRKAARAYNYAKSVEDMPALGMHWSRVDGAHDAVWGLARVWRAIDGDPELAYDERDVRRSFVDCAGGLAAVFSAPDGFDAREPARLVARSAAADWFDALTEGQGS